MAGEKKKPKMTADKLLSKLLMGYVIPCAICVSCFHLIYLFWGSGNALNVIAPGLPDFGRDDETYNGEKYVIVIDSGHSERDGGAVGHVIEYDVVSKTSQELQDLFEQNEKYEVVLTHEFSEDATLEERRDATEAVETDFFISIHCNANAESDSLTGFEVYVQVPENPQHEVSHAIATLISEGFIEGGHTPRRDNGLFYARYERDSSGNSVQYSLTEYEETVLYNFTGETYGVIKSEQYAGLLVEQGYVTSLQDVEGWMTDQGCKKAAEVYYNAITSYFDSLEQAATEDMQGANTSQDGDTQ